MSQQTWCVYNEELQRFECLICMETHRVRPPVRVKAMLAICQAFCLLHKDCRPEVPLEITEAVSEVSVRRKPRR